MSASDDRRALRRRLLAERNALPEADRRAAEAALVARLHRLLAELEGPVALYWPIRGEPDLRPLAAVLAAEGRTLALPVVVARGAPMMFRRWYPGRALVRGMWGIPVPPADEPELVPSVVVVPVVGIGPAGHRLGYGGGCYDRTLAALEPKPTVIGVGFGGVRLEHFAVEPHDRPVDLFVEPSGITVFGRRADAGAR